MLPRCSCRFSKGNGGLSFPAFPISYIGLNGGGSCCMQSIILLSTEDSMLVHSNQDLIQSTYHSRFISHVSILFCQYLLCTRPTREFLTPSIHISIVITYIQLSIFLLSSLLFLSAKRLQYIDQLVELFQILLHQYHTNPGSANYTADM